MRASRAIIGVVTAAVIVGGVAVGVGRGDSASVVSSPAENGVSPWTAMHRPPVPPVEAVTFVTPGSTVLIPAVAGLSGCSAQLDGGRLTTSFDEAGCVVQVTSVDRSGPSRLVITEVFDDGDLELRLTPHLLERLPDAVRPTQFDAPTDVAVSLLWGDGSNEVGMSSPQEGEAQGPVAIAHHRGSLVVLDTANARVVSINADGVASTLAELPGVTFSDLASDAAGERLVAVDMTNASAFDVESGETTELPGILEQLPSDLRAHIAGNLLYLANPIDNVGYSMPPTPASDAGEWMQPDLTAARVAVVDGQLLVQSDLESPPVAVSFGASSFIEVFDAVRVGGGRVAVLVAAGYDAAGVSRQLVVVDGVGASSMPLEFREFGSMTRRMAVDGTSVFVASASGEGFEIVRIDLSKEA